ncbi:hypothetical protein C2E23DRAFT_867571 [Lenzites betulinus]|nr:hypothetical protein C2E23DRAFT_867571 [Lenzites betulinus]
MTTTMAEAFDAQMSDSGDIDVSMYPGGMAASDSWLSAEASMGDVPFSADTATFDYTQEGIEIDMMDDDEAITEYEMAYDDEAYRGLELEDIEVLDDSRAASPPPADHSAIAATGPAEHSEPMHIPPSDHGAPLSQHTHHSPPVYPGATLTVHHTEYPATTSVSHDSLAQSEGDIPSAISPFTPSVSELHAHAEEGEASTGSTSTTAHVEEAVASGEDFGTAESHSLFEPHVDDAEVSSHHNVSVEHALAPDTDKINLPSVDDLAVDPAADTGDPHEISDGVYIDPPPPVLLTLPPAGEYAECCLFNQPQKASGSNASEGAESGSIEELHLLFHDRPTLYYEPLSSVFDALRHEDCVQNLPGYAEAELVMEAYEIQLAISEDNVYAHEVTLHELDVIHDGSDLHGPLRLKLKLVAPRFVTRYHLLRDQIARLNLTADGDESRSGAAMPDPPHDHGVPPAAEANEVRHVEENPLATYDGSVGEVDEKAYPAIDESSHDPNDLDSKHSDQVYEAAEEQQQHEEHAVVSDETSGEAVVAPSEDHVADALEHEEDQQDTGEAGDYVEHDEFPDDEDEFGDDLPEDLGGQTEGLAYAHGSAEDGSYDPAEVEASAVDGNDHENDVASGEAAYDDAAAPSLAQDGEVTAADPQQDENGLNTDGPTDSTAYPHSTHDHTDQHDENEDAERFEKHGTASTVSADNETAHALDADSFAHEDSATLSSEDEDELDDWGDEGDNDVDAAVEPTARAEQVDALSRKSSTNTLASKTSKRTYDEIELDDFDDDPSQLEPGSSPDVKRPRVQ